MSNRQNQESSSPSGLKMAASPAMIAGRSLGIFEPPHKRAKRESAKATAAAYDGERLLPIKVVAAVTSWSRTSINRLVAEVNSPPP